MVLSAFDAPAGERPAAIALRNPHLGQTLENKQDDQRGEHEVCSTLEEHHLGAEARAQCSEQPIFRGADSVAA